MRAEFVEVGPRDGLQNETAILSTEQKVELIERLRGSGLHRIEVASFAHPAYVPQLADAESVVSRLSSDGAFSPIGLVLNRRGFDRARLTNIREANFVIPVTDEYCSRNQGTTVADLADEIAELLPEAKVLDMRTTVTLSVVFGCPFEGQVEPEIAVGLAERFASLGLDELCLADSIGVADPRQVRMLVERIAPVVGKATALRCHFHNTRNTGIANAVAAFEAGVTALDGSVAGIGGCPFAPQATGNVATEDMLYVFERMGVDTGIDHYKLLETSRWLSELLGKEPESMLGRAGWYP